MAEVYRNSRHKLAAIIRRGVQAGELRRLPAARVAAILTASIEGLLLQSLVDADFDAASHSAVLWQVLRDGLSA